MASKIEDYRLIGNLYTVALGSRSGSIDWPCGPRFDSDAFFASLVGYDEHGSWALRPTAGIRETRQRYRDETLILETEFRCEAARSASLTSCPSAARRARSSASSKAWEGELQVEVLLDVRFG